MVFDFLGSKKKVVVAMAHIGALPGSPLYDSAGGLDRLIEGVVRDVGHLQTGGVDAILFGNENDRPYVFKAGPEGVAAMTAVVQAVKPFLSVPFGVNYLWDPVASVAIGVATGAKFVREIFTGVFASDMGVWQPDCAAASRLRHNLHACVQRNRTVILAPESAHANNIAIRADQIAISRQFIPFHCFCEDAEDARYDRRIVTEPIRPRQDDFWAVLARIYVGVRAIRFSLRPALATRECGEGSGRDRSQCLCVQYLRFHATAPDRACSIRACPQLSQMMIAAR